MHWKAKIILHTLSVITHPCALLTHTYSLMHINSYFIHTPLLYIGWSSMVIRRFLAEASVVFLSRSSLSLLVYWLFFEQIEHCTSCGLANCGATNPLASISIKKSSVCVLTLFLGGVLWNLQSELSFSLTIHCDFIDLLSNFMFYFYSIFIVLTLQDPSKWKSIFSPLFWKVLTRCPRWTARCFLDLHTEN